MAAQPTAACVDDDSLPAIRYEGEEVIHQLVLSSTNSVELDGPRTTLRYEIPCTSDDISVRTAEMVEV